MMLALVPGKMYETRRDSCLRIYSSVRSRDGRYMQLRDFSKGTLLVFLETSDGECSFLSPDCEIVEIAESYVGDHDLLEEKKHDR